MGLFSRRAPVAPDAAVNTTSNSRYGDKSMTGVGESHPNAFINQRPTFGEWLKTTWVDILTMAAMGAIGLGVYEADPAPSRSFPVYFRDGEIVYPQFAYPLRKNIIPIWAAAIIASFIPIAIFLVMQIRIKSFWDVNAAVLGLLYSLINAAVFQVFLKWLIGGLRPHFLTVCKPSITRNGQESGTGLDMIMYDRSICTGNKKDIDDSLESFPSGHSTAAFAGFVFLFLYLNAKLKVWSNYHPAFWKMIVTYAPLLGATLIAGSLTIDEFHNWYDCLAGAIIGTICAFGAYRMVYAGIWDWRVNHIPLPRGTNGSQFSGGRHGGQTGFENAVFTRKAGWGAENMTNHGSHHHHHKGNASFHERRDTEATVAPQGGMMTGGSTVLPTHHQYRHSQEVPTQGYRNSNDVV